MEMIIQVKTCFTPVVHAMLKYGLTVGFITMWSFLSALHAMPVTYPLEEKNSVNDLGADEYKSLLHLEFDRPVNWSQISYSTSPRFDGQSKKKKTAKV